jgi:thioredoxin reductase
MKKSQLIITMLLLALLLSVGFYFRLPMNYGGVPWFGWIALAAFAICIGAGLIGFETARRRRYLLAPVTEVGTTTKTAHDGSGTLSPVAPVVMDPDGPLYPHPVINPQTCIGCHACAEACPHDVLAIINGVAVVVAIDQCLEDTSCQVECPTSPKSCIVVNTNKVIPERKAPRRDQKFMTDVPGIYLIGDVSGVPMIKNAINEGGAVIDYIVEDLKQPPANGAADYDVAIIGIGPAGLSATAIAKQRGLKYIAIEQNQVLATIQLLHQAGKLLYFKPEWIKVTGGIPLPDAPASKEVVIQSWMETMRSHQLRINEFESCKGIEPNGGAFVVTTEQEKPRQKMQYKARRVILAIGNRGAAMRLNVPGEDLKIMVTPAEPVFPTFCDYCGAKRLRQAKFCRECGAKYAGVIPAPFEDDRVKYRLSDPNHYQGKHCLVVGAGNSAIEAALDLAAYRSEDGAQITGWRDNTVTLVIRSDFKGDLRLGNKMMVYECIDEGKIKPYFGATVKEITETEVALIDAREPDPRTANEKARIKNDYVFALIGGAKPTKFLESIGVRIG